MINSKELTLNVWILNIVGHPQILAQINILPISNFGHHDIIFQPSNHFYRWSFKTQTYPKSPFLSACLPQLDHSQYSLKAKIVLFAKYLYNYLKLFLYYCRYTIYTIQNFISLKSHKMNTWVYMYNAIYNNWWQCLMGGYQ